LCKKEIKEDEKHAGDEKYGYAHLVCCQKRWIKDCVPEPEVVRCIICNEVVLHTERRERVERDGKAVYRHLRCKEYKELVKRMTRLEDDVRELKIRTGGMVKLGGS
jgi:hypothetical protein